VKLNNKKQLEAYLEDRCFNAIQEVEDCHKKLMDVQWTTPPTPEYYDQQIALYYNWKHDRNSHWLERGAYASLALHGGNVLDLCCGDGFMDYFFFSSRSNGILAIDYNQEAINTAKRKNAAENIKYVLMDILNEFPVGEFDNVVWNGAIEHFDKDEIKKILSNIKFVLSPIGVLSGFTVVEKGQVFEHHKMIFNSKEELANILKPCFRKVTVFETIHKDRHNLYFWASDTSVPFDNNWKGSCSK